MQPVFPIDSFPAFVSLSVNATISKEWKQRMLLIMLVVGGMGGWFLFDGLIGYPRHNEWASEYFELQEQHGKDTPELTAAWNELCTQRNWPKDVPKKIYLPGDIHTQLILGGIGWVVVGGIFVHFLRSLPRSTRLENGRIFLPDGREIDIQTVRVLSKKRWKNKGIADLAYEPSPGTSARFLLDDYKYAGADQIVAEIEKMLGTAPSPDEAK